MAGTWTDFAMVFFFILGIVLIVLGASISSKARNSDPQSQQTVAHSATGVWAIGLIFTVCSLLVFGVNYGQSIKQLVTY